MSSKYFTKQKLIHPWQWLDWLYLQTSKGKMFNGGWGDEQLISQVLEQCQQQSKQPNPPVAIEPVFTPSVLGGYDYQFTSPIADLPNEVKQARGCIFVPDNHSDLYELPLCISMPGTGDEGYARRIKSLAEPLARQGIATLIMENPFYGSRRRHGQHKHYISTVSDFILMFYSAVQECLALVHHWWSKGQSRIGLTGLSMGGQAVSLVASQLTKPVAVVAGLAPSSVAQLYSYGYMSVVCDWQALSQNLHEHQAKSKLEALLSMGDIINYPVPNQCICSVVNAKNDTYIPLDLSQHFVEHWPHSDLKLINGGHISSILFKNHHIVKEVHRTIAMLPA